jgi:hypothetical protein
MLFKNSLRTIGKLHFSIAKNIWLMPFREVTAVSSAHDTGPINTICIINITVGGTYSYHWAFKR